MSTETERDALSSPDSDTPPAEETSTTPSPEEVSPPVAFTAEEVAAKVGVLPTDTRASPQKRKRAYWWFKKLLTISQLLDPLQIPNSFVNYQCVWWKAITGNTKFSPLQDGGLAYDLLPPVTRLAVAPAFAQIYPRFVHGNVELRTKYLDTAMDQIVNEHLPQDTKKIRLVLLGGGYDLRSIQMALKYQNDTLKMDLVELDLPNVIEAKQTILQERLLKRRPWLKEIVDQVQMISADLNEVETVEAIVKKLAAEGDETTFTIFVFEAVLIYLDEGVPSQLLSILSEALKQTNQAGALCFADTISNMLKGQEYEAREKLIRNGWDLKDWLTKPGRTKHLGWAVLPN